MKIILSILILFFSACDNPNADIYGCLDDTACNYNINATISDDSCTYSELNYDCDGNCAIDSDCSGECGGNATIDCAGECGGSATVDNCGTCDGDTSNDCLEDCFGNWGGTAILDDCGECGGTDLIFDGYCQTDIDFLNDMIQANPALLSLGLDATQLGTQTWLDNRLVEIDISGASHEITTLPSSVSNLTYLRDLRLYSTDISMLPNEIRYLFNLEDLYLGYNHSLVSLPDNLSSLINLKDLDLTSCNFSIFPGSIFDLVGLEDLYMSYNELTSLPANFCSLPSGDVDCGACHIDLRNNNLCEQYHYDCIDEWEPQDCQE